MATVIRSACIAAPRRRVTQPLYTSPPRGHPNGNRTRKETSLLPRAVVPEASRIPSVSSDRPAETCAGEREPHLAERITRAASKQSYYTIPLLVDRCPVADAFRSYAYFRWVDDMLDEMLSAPQERLD